MERHRLRTAFYLHAGKHWTVTEDNVKGRMLQYTRITARANSYSLLYENLTLISKIFLKTELILLITA